MKYIHKPTEVEAIRLPQKGDYNLTAFHEWCDRVGFTEYESAHDETMIIRNKNGATEANPGDWIVKVGGDFYAVSPGNFEKAFIEYDPWANLMEVEIQEMYWNHIITIVKTESDTALATLMNQFIVRKQQG